MINEWFRKLIYGGGVFFDVAKWLIFAIILLVIVQTYFMAVFVVSGHSMEPNFHDKELVIWQKNFYANKVAPRGDVVVVNYPGDPVHKKYVKRIVGLPGEKVEVKNERVYINGKLLAEPYLAYGVLSDPDGSWTLKNNEYFVMGDNRPGSNDSRYFGPVESRFLLGKAIAIVFPRFRLVKDM